MLYWNARGQKEGLQDGINTLWAVMNHDPEFWANLLMNIKDGVELDYQELRLGDRINAALDEMEEESRK